MNVDRPTTTLGLLVCQVAVAPGVWSITMSGGVLGLDASQVQARLPCSARDDDEAVTRLIEAAERGVVVGHKQRMDAVAQATPEASMETH